MKLIKVKTSACRNYECEYVCTECERPVNGNMNFCPECGHKLQKEGKPDEVHNGDHIICAIIANAINLGLFKNGIPKGTESGESWSYYAEAEPTKM